MSLKDVSSLAVFKNDCLRASGLLNRFEDARYSDGESCKKALMDLPTPEGLEEEWRYVKKIWLTYYESGFVNLETIETPGTVKLVFNESRMWRSGRCSDSIVGNIREIGHKRDTLRNNLQS